MSPARGPVDAVGAARRSACDPVASVRMRGSWFGEQPFHDADDLFLALLVELARGLAGEPGVGAADAAVPTDEERRRERVQVLDLRHFLGELLRLADEEHRVIDPEVLHEGFEANRILELIWFLERKRNHLES